MKSRNPSLVRIGKWIIIPPVLFIINILFPILAVPQVISPRISVTSFQDSAGIMINIQGAGFSSGGTATLYSKNPDGSQSGIQYTGISSDGSFTLSHLFPTGQLPGTYFLWAVDGATGRYSNTIDFNMPAIQSTEMKMPPPPYSPAYTPKHGDLIRAKGDTKIYLIHNIERRAIVTEEVFKQMGFKWSDVKDIDSQDMMSIPEGPPIWSKEIIASFSEGTLIRLKGKTQTYIIRGGRKCYIPDPDTLYTMGYKWDQVIEVDQATLDSILTGIPIQSVKPPFQYTPPGQQPGVPPPPYPPPPSYPPPSQWPPQPYGGSPIQPGTGSTPYQPQPQPSFQFFPNGTLIKGSGPGIYVIENGVRRLIPDMETFNAMGLNWNSIINVDDQKLGSLPMGIPFPKKR